MSEKTVSDWASDISPPVEIKPKRIRLKFEYNGKPWPGTIALRVTFTATGASGIMYVRPDALPCKYGME